MLVAKLFSQIALTNWLSQGLRLDLMSSFFIKQEMKKTIKIMTENILMRWHLKVIVRRPVPTSEPPYMTLLNL